MRPSPSEIGLSANKASLRVVFGDEFFTISAELLRVLSPSAEVQGHGSEERVTVAGKRAVTITKIEPVGHYAVRLVFSDGHASGLYSWDVLYKYGSEGEALFAEYCREIEALGLSRDG